MNVIDKYLGGKVVGKQKRWMFCLILLIALGFEGFRFFYWKNSYNILYYFALLLIVFSFLLSFKSLKVGHFSNYVLFFALFPFVSVINTISMGESYTTSIIQTFKTSALWLVYYLLHSYNVKERTLLKMMLYIGIFIAIVEIIQQFTYPHILFGGYSSEDLQNGTTEELEIRNGFIRFRCHINLYFTMPFILLLLEWIANRINAKMVLLFVFLTISVYLTLTRQIITSFIFVFFFSLFYRKKIRILSLVLFFIAFAVILVNISFLVGGFIEQTRDEFGEDNIRLLAANYFWKESIKSPLAFLLGYGHPLEFEQNLATNLHFYIADIGFIGAIWRFGVIFVIFNYYLMYKLFVKHKDTTPRYIKLFVLYAAIMSIMIYPFTSNIMTLIWPILLYICDLRIDRSPLALQQV